MKEPADKKTDSHPPSTVNLPFLDSPLSNSALRDLMQTGGKLGDSLIGTALPNKVDEFSSPLLQRIRREV